MKFHCPECNAKYRISEDKISSRPTAKLRCKQCSHLFVVREAVEREVRHPTVSIAPGADPQASMSATAARPQTKTVPKAPTQALVPARSGGTTKAQVGKLPRPSSPPPPTALAEELKPPEPQERSSSVNDMPDPERVSDVRSSSVPRESPAPTTDLEGWFVEADGEPQGPLTEELLRKRVATGLIDRETLVWREGAADWKAAESVSAFDSLWNASALQLAVDAEDSPATVKAGAQLEDTTSVLSATSAEGASDVDAPKEDEPRTAGSGAQLGSKPDSDPKKEEPKAPPPPEPAIAKAPKAKAPTAGASVPVAATSLSPGVSLSPGYMPPKPGKTVPAALAWASMCVGSLFGLGIGFLLWGASQTQVQPVTVAAARQSERTPVGQHAAPPPPPDQLGALAAPAQPAEPDVVASGEPVDLAAAVAANLPGSARRALPDAVGNNAGHGGLLSGLGPSGAPGPSVGDNKGSFGGPSLSASQIEKAVQRYQPSVKRGCWQQALDGRAVGAPTSARVAVTINISPSGSVAGVSSGADPAGYPGLAGCIKNRVRGWQFPSAGGATTTKVPFVFAAQ